MKERESTYVYQRRPEANAEMRRTEIRMVGSAVTLGRSYTR